MSHLSIIVWGSFLIFQRNPVLLFIFMCTVKNMVLYDVVFYLKYGFHILFILYIIIQALLTL